MPPTPNNPGKLFATVATAGTLVFAVTVLIARRMQSPETAAGVTQMSEKLLAKGHKQALENVKKACDQAPKSCDCHQAMALAALDADLGQDALDALDRDESCAKKPKSQGMRAEALVRAGDTQGGRAQAERVRKVNPKDPFAACAMALLAYRASNDAEALTQAGSAIDFGRGAPAHLLMVVVLYRAQQFDAAHRHLNQILASDPDNVDALYNRALIAQRTNSYHDAREGYLKVLRLAPKNADARYNLGILTHSVGAMDEAHHNLERLVAIVGPNDERVKKLKAVLNGPKPSPAAAMVFKKPRGSASAPLPASSNAR